MVILAKTEINAIKEAFATGKKPTGEDFENLIDSCFQEVTVGDLDGKADDVHTHTVANITGLQATLDGKADKAHAHTIANVTGLQTALDGKLTASKAVAQATSTATDVSGLVADFNSLLGKLKSAGIIA